MMTQKNGAQYGTNFTVSIEAAHGISTGISAADRALTIQTAVSPAAKAEDIVQPGHIFPCAHKKAACWCAPATPKQAWIWHECAA